MPADLATLQARLDALKLGLANSRQEVSYAGRVTRYRSIAEIQAAIKSVETDIAALNGTAITRTFRFCTSKGL
jgi:hypothetical protein